MASELRRRKGRTLLTALGLGVGVGLVVAVSALSAGLDEAPLSAGAVSGTVPERADGPVVQRVGPGESAIAAGAQRVVRLRYGREVMIAA